jgi:hypothetical protein
MPLGYDFFLYRLTHETAVIPCYLKRNVIAPKRSTSEVAHCYRVYWHGHRVNFVTSCSVFGSLQATQRLRFHMSRIVMPMPYALDTYTAAEPLLGNLRGPLHFYVVTGLLARGQCASGRSRHTLSWFSSAFKQMLR